MNNTNVHSKFTLISLFSKIHSLKSEHIHSFLFREYPPPPAHDAQFHSLFQSCALSFMEKIPIHRSVVMRLSIQPILWDAVWRKFAMVQAFHWARLSTFKTTLPRKTSPRIKTPNPQLMILVSFYSKNRNVYQY